MFFTPLPHRVRLEALAAGRDAEGGNTETPAVVADNVPCLISQGSGARAPRLDQQPVSIKYTISGTDPALGRQDVRAVVLVGPRQGKTLRVVGVSEHGPGAFLLGKFYRMTAEELMTGAG